MRSTCFVVCFTVRDLVVARDQAGAAPKLGAQPIKYYIVYIRLKFRIACEYGNKRLCLVRCLWPGPKNTLDSSRCGRVHCVHIDQTISSASLLCDEGSSQWPTAPHVCLQNRLRFYSRIPSNAGHTT